jgi:magnesium transporter
MTSATEELHQGIQTAARADDPSALANTVAGAHAADIAEVFELLDDEDRSKVLFALPAATAAEVIVLLDEADRGEVVEDMDQAELTELVSEMEPDDAADVLGELTEEQREDVLEHIPAEHSGKIEELLTYEEDTAGGIMTKNLVSLPSNASVGEAIREIRQNFLEEDIHYIYVVDDQDRLTGVVPLRRLVLNEKHVALGDICERDPISVRVDDDQEEVVHVISKYDIAAVPVVDHHGHLLGRITHDDVMDVIEEEADEDIYRMAGVDAAEFEKSSLIRAAGIRLSWLVPCMAAMAITGAVMMFARKWFTDVEIYAALIIFVPMIGAVGGNSGIQISTIIVRGLATGDLAGSKFAYALLREGRIAVLLAPACGLAAALICYGALPMLQRVTHAPETEGQPPPAPLAGAELNQAAFAVGMGMTVAILVAASLGIVLPFIFRRLNVDPAIASGPIVTTANDILSVSVFLALASVIMTL